VEQLKVAHQSSEENITDSNTRQGGTEDHIPPVTTHNILYYTAWWEDHPDPKSWDLGEGSWMFASCPHKNCYLTSNKQFLPHLHQYSALLFHTWKLFAKDVSIPVERSPLQKYIMFSIEPFSHCAYLNSWEEKVLENFFNSTFTFRKDSDISTPYGRILEKNIGQNVGATELQAGFPKTELYSELSSNLSSKTGSVLWLASHCWTDSRREDYVKELDKHLTVSVIGSCAKGLGKDSAKDEDLSKYYFYLAFENSRCKDYVTEKFFRGMQGFVIPVVLGGSGYSSIAPPHSYIDVRDYTSPQHLAQYLIHLIDNQEEYLAYFWWKPHYQVFSDVNPLTPHALPTSFPCNLCTYLNTGTVSQVTNLTKIWREDAECENTSTYHCNRDKEKWFPRREEYRKKLEDSEKTFIVELQKMIT